MVKFEVNPRLLAPVGMPAYVARMSDTTASEIRAALVRLEKSQAWLAEKMGVSDTAVHKWLSTGEVARDRLLPLAELLGITVDQLLSGSKPLGATLLDIVEALAPDDRRMTLDYLIYRAEKGDSAVAEAVPEYQAILRELRDAVDHKAPG